MFTITDEAVKELDAYFEGQDKSAIRVFLTSGGCKGPMLALALDEANAEDSVFDEKGYTFCINKELLDTAKAVTIGCSSMGFSVESEKPLGGEGGCSSCGGGCSH